MGEEQAVFVQLNLRDFKMWSPTLLKPFNNNSIIMKT